MEINEQINSLIKQAVKEGLFASYGDAIVCAMVTSPLDKGRREATIKALEQTIEVRRKDKNETKTP